MKTNHKKLIIQLIALLTVCFASPAFAQNRTVRGSVTDSGSGAILPGVTVVVLDQNNRMVTGTITDFNGNYVINVFPGANKLSFAFIGYESQEVIVGENLKIDIKLKEGVQLLDDVQIIATKRSGDGISSIAARDIASPVVTVDLKDMDGVQANSVDELLQGRVTGVDIAANSGDPGAGMSIRIRGTSTLNANSKPLIVVDNVPYNIDIGDDFDFGSEDEQGYGDLLNIAPEDIKEITVLKDASATAMWGTKAANGVLLITTKRGVKKKPTISYTHKSTWTFKMPALPMLNGDQYSTMILEGYLNSFGYPLNTTLNKEFLYDPSDPYWYYNYSNNTDWYDECYSNSYQHTHNLTLNGGGEKVAYNLAVNYKNQDGLLVGTGYTNLSTRLNLDYRISDKLKVRTDFTFTSGVVDRNYDYKYFGSVMYNKMPNMAVYEYDEYGNETPNYFTPETNIQGGYSSTYNPVALAKEGVYTLGSDELISNFALDYNFLKPLTFRTLVSYKVKNNTEKKFLPQIASGVNINSSIANMSNEYDADNTELYTDTKLVYMPEIGDKHEFITTLQLTSFSGNSNSYTTGAANSPSSLLQDVINGTNSLYTSLGSSITEHKNFGALALFNYKYDDKYIFAATLRQEGNSRFNEKYRFSTFKSLSFSYRISGEGFMEDVDWVDDLRLSASWGENGNLPKYEYLYYNRYASYNWTYLGQTGIYPSSMQLDNLRWETIKSQNLQLTAALFRNRVKFTGDLYKRKTFDVLDKDSELPSTSGYSSIYQNVGNLDNQGWELSFEATPVKTRDFLWRVNFNISRNSDIWRKVTDNFQSEKGVTTNNGQYKEIIQVDNPVGSFYGYRYKGVYKDAESTIARDANGDQIFDAQGNPIQMVFDYPNTSYEFEPGDAIYEDINHDGNINYMDVVYLGNMNPDFYGGFGTFFSFKKKLSVNMFFNYRYGNEIINKNRMLSENMYYYNNQSTSTLRRWRNEGDETDIPRALLYGGYNWLGSDRYVEDGSFIRLRYITVKYELPKSMANTIKMKNMFVMGTITNVYTWTKYKGMNPDISDGYDTAQTPVSPSFTFTLSMTF